MTARDLFADLQPAEESSRARAFAPGSVEWYAQRQAELRSAGEASARAFHETRRVAKAAAQEGIDRAVGCAERRSPGWSDRALAWIRAYAQANRGRRFTGFELVQASVVAGFEQPENPKAWGGPIQRASRAGALRKVGTVADPNPERHGSDVPNWEAV